MSQSIVRGSSSSHVKLRVRKAESRLLCDAKCQSNTFSTEMDLPIYASRLSPRFVLMARVLRACESSTFPFLVGLAGCNKHTKGESPERQGEREKSSFQRR